MFKKLIWKYIGKVLIGFSLILSLPILVSFIYHESSLPFLIPATLSLLLGVVLNSISIKDKSMYTKDGFIIVALSWIIISLIGALPFVINKDANYIDALFETVSGFTTTGASIFDDVEILNKSILFWRSYMHFIGGMGVLTLVMAIIPLSKRDNSMHVLKAEMPGPSVDKLVPNTKKTLKYLYLIYISLTVIELILLMFGGLNFFDSLLISMGTAGTGGFSILNSGLATYSLFNKYIVAIFMFLFGINFNVYFLIIMKDIKSIIKSEELKYYIGIFILTVLIVLLNTYQLFDNLKDAAIDSIFHVSSIMTSTGYSIGNINIYPTSCRVILLLVMLISACTGSTCGGFKIKRLIIIIKTIKRDIQKIMYPSRVKSIRLEGKIVDDSITQNTISFMFLYIIIIFILLFIVSFDGLSLSTTINAVFSTFANTGLCFDLESFSILSNLSKITLSIGMLLGRLEIFPIVVLFSKRYK